MASRDVQVFLAGLSHWAAVQGRAPHVHRYASGPEHEADLLLPDGSGPHRVAVLLHGGFWRARFTRTTMAALAVNLAERGWATWNVEYRRVRSGGGVRETLEDVRAAVDALSTIEAPLDCTQVLLIGHSAGGQLALCIAEMPVVAAVASLAGVCDLGSAARERIGESAALEFIGGTPEERPEAYATADPLGSAADRCEGAARTRRRGRARARRAEPCLCAGCASSGRYDVDITVGAGREAQIGLGKPGLSLASPKKILYEKKGQTHDPGYPQNLHSSW